MNMRTRSGGSTPTKVIDPKYANSTSSLWVFGAFAELIDNACDPIINAENQWIDWTQIKDKDCLTFTDDGAGLTYDTMLKMMSDKKTIQWFKSGFMRLGKDAIVFSKTWNTMIVGLLSQTYETNIRDEHYVVPIVVFIEDGDKFTVVPGHRQSLKAILEYSLFNTEEELQRELQAISTTSLWESTGTRVIIWNLCSSRGRLEFDFETDPHDIRLPEGPGLDLEPKSIYSLRAYCSILYLKPRMQIIIRGKKVHPQLISHVLEHTHEDQYDSNSLEEPITITFGYDPEKKRPGMLLYYKKRLIVANKHVGLRRRVTTTHDLGLVGIAECDFLEPTDSKQDFKASESYTRFRNSFTEKMLKYRNKAKYSRWKKDPRRTNAVENGETRTTDEDSEDSEDEQPCTSGRNVAHTRTLRSDSIAAMNYDSEADVNEVATPLRAPEGDQQLSDASVPEDRMETNTRAAVTDQTERVASRRESALEENITSSGEDHSESLEETLRQLGQEPHDQVHEGEDSLTRQIFNDLNHFKDDVNQRIDHKFEEFVRRLEDLRGAGSSTVSPRPAQSAGAVPSQPGSPEAVRQKKQQQERNRRQTAEDGASTSSAPATPSAQSGARPCDSGSESPQEGTSSAPCGSHGLKRREPSTHATPRGKRFSLSAPSSEQAKRAKSDGERSSSSAGTEAVSEPCPSSARLHWTMDDFRAVVVFTEEATPLRNEGDISQQLDNGAIPAEPMETNTTAADPTSAVQQSVSVATQTEGVTRLKQEVEEKNTRRPVEHQPQSLEQTQGQQIASKTANRKGDQYKEQLDAANQKTEQYRDQAEAANGERDQYKEQLDAANQKIEQYRDQAEAANRERDQCKKELDSANQKIEQYRDQAEAANRERDQCKKELDSANQKIEQFRDQAEAANRERDQCKKELDAANQKIEQYRDQAEAANRERDQCKKELDAANQKIEQYRDQAEAATRERDQCRKELDEANQKIEQYRDHAGAANRERDQCIAKVNQLQQKLQPMRSSQVEQEPSDQGEDDLTMQWDSIFTDLRCFKDEMDQLRNKCEEQRRELEDLREAGSSTVSPRPAQSAGAGPSQPGSSEAERLGSLRVNVSRLLLMLIPDLDLDQVNYESTVIEEILDQYLEGVSRSGAE